MRYRISTISHPALKHMRTVDPCGGGGGSYMVYIYMYTCQTGHLALFKHTWTPGVPHMKPENGSHV